MEKRNDWSISALRMAAMCSIVACHLCQLYGLGAAWVLNIGVQVFLVISGWLYGMRPDIADVGAWYARRLLRICLPYWLVLIPLLLVDAFFASQAVTAKTVLLSITCVRSGSVPNAAHFWYISAMLLCYLVTPLLGALWRRWGSWPLVLCACVFLLAGNHIVAQGAWCVDYVIAFVLGRLVRDGMQEKKVLGMTAVVSGGGCAALVLADCLWGLSAYTGLHLLGGPLLFSVFRLLLGCEAFTPGNRLKRLLELDDSYSYEVYLVHQILILGDFSLALLFPTMPILVVLFAIAWSLVAGFTVHVVSTALRNVIEPRLMGMAARKER